MNELLQEICEVMKNMDVIRSDIQFSAELLQRSPRLYSWAKSSKHAPALDVLLGLYNRLDDLCEKFKRENKDNNANVINDLTDRLWQKMREESLTKTFFTRKKPVIRPSTYRTICHIAPEVSSHLDGIRT